MLLVDMKLPLNLKVKERAFSGFFILLLQFLFELLEQVHNADI